MESFFKKGYDVIVLFILLLLYTLSTTIFDIIMFLVILSFSTYIYIKVYYAFKSKKNIYDKERIGMSFVSVIVFLMILSAINMSQILYFKSTATLDNVKTTDYIITKFLDDDQILIDKKVFTFSKVQYYYIKSECNKTFYKEIKTYKYLLDGEYEKIQYKCKEK